MHLLLRDDTGNALSVQMQNTFHQGKSHNAVLVIRFCKECLVDYLWEVNSFLYELEDGEFKVSTRSKELVDLSEIAVKFDGGGHVRAAGFSMKGEPEQIIEAILQEVKKQL